MEERIYRGEWCKIPIEITVTKDDSEKIEVKVSANRIIGGKEDVFKEIEAAIKDAVEKAASLYTVAPGNDIMTSYSQAVLNDVFHGRGERVNGNESGNVTEIQVKEDTTE